MTGILASVSLAAEVRGNKREDGENRSHAFIMAKYLHRFGQKVMCGALKDPSVLQK